MKIALRFLGCLVVVVLMGCGSKDKNNKVGGNQKQIVSHKDKQSDTSLSRPASSEISLLEEQTNQDNTPSAIEMAEEWCRQNNFTVGLLDDGKSWCSIQGEEGFSLFGHMRRSKQDIDDLSEHVRNSTRKMERDGDMQNKLIIYLMRCLDEWSCFICTQIDEATGTSSSTMPIGELEFHSEKSVDGAQYAEAIRLSKNNKPFVSYTVSSTDSQDGSSSKHSSSVNCMGGFDYTLALLRKNGLECELKESFKDERGGMACVFVLRPCAP